MDRTRSFQLVLLLDPLSDLAFLFEVAEEDVGLAGLEENQRRKVILK
jgi:hypothetical protein